MVSKVVVLTWSDDDARNQVVVVGGDHGGGKWRNSAAASAELNQCHGREEDDRLASMFKQIARQTAHQ